MNNLEDLCKLEQQVEEFIDNETKTEKDKPKNHDAFIEHCQELETLLSVKEKQLQNLNFKLNISFRIALTFVLLGFILCWMIYIGKLVWCEGLNNGIKLKMHGFYLQENIMIALLGTTTATVVGLFVIVTKYFFHNDNSTDLK